MISHFKEQSNLVTDMPFLLAVTRYEALLFYAS